MKILLLNQYYPPDVAATGQLLADVADALAATGHEVHVVCSRRSYADGRPTGPARETGNGVHLHRVAATGFGRKVLAGRLFDYGSFYLLAMLRALRLGRMDVCLALTTPPLVGLVAVVLGRLRGTRLVLWSMDVYPEVAVAYGALRPRGPVHAVVARLSARLYRSAHAIVSLGRCMTSRLIAAGADPARIVEVPNWSPGDAVQPIPRAEARHRGAWDVGDAVTLMYSGNIGLGHELDTALRGLAALAPEGRPRLVLLGETRDRSEVVARVRAAGVDDVIVRPPVPLSELSESLAAGDIHLVSQRPGTEGLIVPSKIYGILAAGRPCIFIGPENCEVADIVRSSASGLVVRPGDCAAAAAALQTFAGDPERRETAGRAARRHADELGGRDRSVRRIAWLLTRR